MDKQDVLQTVKRVNASRARRLAQSRLGRIALYGEMARTIDRVLKRAADTLAVISKDIRRAMAKWGVEAIYSPKLSHRQFSGRLCGR